MARVNDAILERLERVIETLQENNQKMGQMLAVHDEKLDKQDRIDAVLFEKVESVHREVNRQATEIKKGCERDIRKVDEKTQDHGKENVEHIWCSFYYFFRRVSSRTKNSWDCLDTEK